MTCKDCLSHGVCYAVHSAGEFQEYAEVCNHFKNKADFVEVGKIKKLRADLKYWVDTNEEQGVVYIPLFVAKKILKEIS